MGRFAWNTTTGQWAWDTGMFELHGYPPAAVVVSTDLVVGHKREEHRARAAALLQRSASEDRRFSNYHDIVDVEGRVRTVLTVGVSRVGAASGGVRHRLSEGFMVDVTQDESDRTRLAITRMRQSVAPIAQTVGLLMGSLGLSEDTAFEVLSRVSQHRNVKVRELAEHFMVAAVSSAADSSRDLLQVLVDVASTISSQRDGAV